MTDNITTMSNREIAKQATVFAHEWVLMNKAFTFAHSVCSRAKPLIAQSISTLRKKPLRITTITGKQGTLCGAGKAAKRVSGAAKEISKESRLALESFRADYMVRLEPEIVKLKKTFDCTRKGFAESANKWIKVDYEHIFGVEFKFNKKGKLNIGGFHHDPMGLIEDSGFLEFSNKIVGKGGTYGADLVCNGKIVKWEATFFPLDWSREIVASKIHEAYDNFAKNGIRKLHRGGYLIEGTTSEGIIIEMFITKKGRMITAYPKP